MFYQHDKINQKLLLIPNDYHQNFLDDKTSLSLSYKQVHISSVHYSIVLGRLDLAYTLRPISVFCESEIQPTSFSYLIYIQLWGIVLLYSM